MNNTDILLITPPFTQLNTPYPATPFLKGFLEGKNFSVAQLDLGIETIDGIFSSGGLRRLFESLPDGLSCPDNSRNFLQRQEEYLSWIDPVMDFLRGRQQSLAHRICRGELPEGQRFNQLPDMDWLFGELGIHDKARFLATLFIEDIGDFITDCIDENFGFSRYAERMGLKAVFFEAIEKSLALETGVTRIMLEILEGAIKEHDPRVVAFTVPFPGNLLAALKGARFIKERYPEIRLILGGGFVNTELRNLNEPALFDLVDFVCLDDGELTLRHLLDYLLRDGGEDKLVRTFIRRDGRVLLLDSKELSDYPHRETGTPDYRGLPLHKYISVMEIANPMHRLWSDGRWNKLMLAHGCYWHRCAFCDVSLDYIKRYSAASAAQLVDRIEAVIAQTGECGFHFVDEAAPPALLRELSTELLRRRVHITWWTNIRFEGNFDAALCSLMSEAGCIAVSGGLEVASDRLLEKMQKGVTVEQAVKVCRSLADAGIMVHAYLMYGFPTQSAQETIDALEVVRQLFEHDLVQSGYWHRFAMTVHSPVGMDPEAFGVRSLHEQGTFANNDCGHEDPTGCDHGRFAFGLKKALYNYMYGQCFDFPLQEWFDFRIPGTTVPRNYVSRLMRKKS